jgi:hypothetical protein
MLNSLALLRMDPEATLGCESEIGITGTFINAMCDVWGIATGWRNDLNSRKVCFEVRFTVDMLTEAGIPGRSWRSRPSYQSA